MNDKERLGTIFAITAAIISGFSIPLNKIFVVNLDPTVFTAVRSVIIGVAFFTIISYRSKFSYKNFKKVSWKYMILIAIIGGSFAFLLFFNGLKLTTAGRSALLQKTLPLYVTVLAFLFLKEKISRKYMLALFLMFLGTLAIYFTQISITELWSNPSLGDILVISATFLWAVENIIARKTMIKGDNNFIVSFSRMLFGGLILFGFVILFGKLDLLLNMSAQQITNILISTLILFGYVLFWYWSIKMINVSKASSFLLLSPAISLLVGTLFLGEPAPLIEIIGSMLILIGAYYLSNTKSESSYA
jgi:drug/metabolite transporter (DMT)-like permease